MGTKVLFVDDDPDLRKLMKIALEFEGLEVSTAHDGLSAIEQALAGRPEVIVTDLVMPGVGGEELLRRLAGSPQLRDIPVMVLTARAPCEDLEYPPALSVEFMRKPVDPLDLAVAISRLGSERLNIAH